MSIPSNGPDESLITVSLSGTGRVIPGDANMDGVINVIDMTKVARIILLMASETPGADTDLNGVVNALNMTKIARIILGLD